MAPVLVVLTACSGADGTGPINARLSLAVVDGGGQSAVGGSELPAAVVVRVTDAKTQLAAANQMVNFVVTSGGGHVFAGAALTNASGEARERWTLGSKVGTQTLEARAVDQTTGDPIVYATITATGLPQPPIPPAAILTIGSYRVRVFGASLSTGPGGVVVVYAMDMDVLNLDDTTVPCSALHLYHDDGSELTYRYTADNGRCGFGWNDPNNPVPEPDVRHAWIVINGDESTRTEIWKNYWP